MYGRKCNSSFLSLDSEGRGWRYDLFRQCLLYKHEEPSLDFQHVLNLAAQFCNFSAGEGVEGSLGQRDCGRCQPSGLHIYMHCTCTYTHYVCATAHKHTHMVQKDGTAREKRTDRPKFLSTGVSGPPQQKVTSSSGSGKAKQINLQIFEIKYRKLKILVFTGMHQKNQKC